MTVNSEDSCGISSGSALFANMKIIFRDIHHNLEISTLNFKMAISILMPSTCMRKSIRTSFEFRNFLSSLIH